MLIRIFTLNNPQQPMGGPKLTPTVVISTCVLSYQLSLVLGVGSVRKLRHCKAGNVNDQNFMC